MLKTNKTSLFVPEKSFPKPNLIISQLFIYNRMQPDTLHNLMKAEYYLDTRRKELWNVSKQVEKL